MKHPAVAFVSINNNYIFGGIRFKFLEIGIVHTDFIWSLKLLGIEKIDFMHQEIARKFYKRPFLNLIANQSFRAFH